MDWPPFLKVQTDSVLLAVKVQPRASRNEIGGVVGAELRIRVTAPPVESAANDAAVELVARRLGVGRRGVELVRGRTSRHKVLRIRGRRPEEILRALEMRGSSGNHLARCGGID